MTSTPRPIDLASRRKITALSAWLAVLLFIYPMKHTIALRNVMLFAGLASTIWCLRPPSAGIAVLRRTLAGCGPIGAVLLLLSAWMVVQSATLGLHPAESLLDWRGDWLVPLLVAAAGVLAASTAGDKPEAGGRLVTGAVFGLLANIGWYLAFQAFRYVVGEPVNLALTPFAARDYHSFINNTLFALLLAEALFRSLAHRRFMPLSSQILTLILVISLLATYMLSTRNGTIGVIALLLLALFLWWQAKGSLRSCRALILIAAGSIAVAGFATLAVKADARWQGFAQAARAGLDIETNRFWLDNSHPIPLTAAGTPVEDSTYLRVAWARAAIEQIIRHPLGVGYGGRAFGWAVVDSYHTGSRLQSSHNGLLDFTIANGLPGIALWLLLTWLLCRHGWAAFSRQQSPAGLFLIFTVVCYFARLSLDGVLNGFRLEMYALLVGMTLALSSCTIGACGTKKR